MWQPEHEAPFACIDNDTPSRLLVTTRIKTLLRGSTEIELALLGLQESVELLAGIAELQNESIPPECLQIAQLCGRLPLCLAIVGRLIQQYGTDKSWTTEVPSMLKTVCICRNDAKAYNANMDSPYRYMFVRT
jgi:hypothetical protein